MSTPEVRVRLSPEGIKEVIAELRELQKEGEKARRSAGQGVSTLSSALRELKSLLPAIGFAAVVGGFVALTRQALATADATGKLQQKVGGTVEEISGLTLAFRQNQGNQESLQQALLKTASFQGDVAAGNEKARDTLRRLGIEAEAFTKLTTPRALEQIGKKLAAIPPSANRAAAAADIFGDKVGGKLIIALNAVGTQGIDPFIAKAKELGVLIDSDLADAAARANDSLETIKIQAEGLATQFASGLAPAVAGAMEEFTRAVSGGTNGMQTFGRIVGLVVRGVTFLFISLGKIIGARIAQVVNFIETLAEAAKLVASGEFEKAGQALARGVRDRRQIGKELQNDLAETTTRLLNPEEPAARPTTGSGDGTLPPIDDSARRTAQARQAFVRQALQAELKLQQEGIKSAEDAVKRGYDRGVLSLKQFFDKRRELIEQNATAEVAALRLERQAVLEANSGEQAPKTEAERIKLRQELAKITQQIAIVEKQSARELAALDNDRFEAQKALTKEQLDLDTQLAELEGNRHRAFQNNLQSEIQQIQELGRRAGLTAVQIQAQVDRLTSASTARFDFEEVTRKGEAALTAFNRDADQIRRDQEAGVISQLEGEQRLIELERQRLVVLKKLAQQMLAAAQATGSEEQIAKAQQYADAIDEIAASYKGATDAGAKLRTGTINSLQEGFETLLNNVDSIHSVGDAFRQLALTVVQALQKIVAEILAQQATLALVKAFGSAFGASAGGGGGTDWSGQAANVGFGFRGGLVSGYNVGGLIRGVHAARLATGGAVRGPTLNVPGPDKVPIMAQEGEFMVRKAKVMEPGALDFLRKWNGGTFRLSQVMKFPRFATGGQIGAPQGTPAAAQQQSGGQGLRIVNLLDPNLVSDALASASGERAVMNTISRNSVTLKRMLGVR